MRQLALLSLIRAADARGAQFVVATQAPILMAYPEAALDELSDGGPTPASFDDLEHVRTLKGFLNEPEAYLRHL